ncbi:MAG: sulfatase-like hydrolase/transferase [Planctomycetota bacterium]
MCCTATLSHAEATQPSILWIVTDDQRPDSIQAYNRAIFGTDDSPLGYVESPVADRLAAEGVLFTNAICNSPVCAPSRATLHSGRYPFRSGHYNFEQSHQGPDFVRPTVMQTLSDEGYYNASFGKSDSYIFRWGPGQGFHDAGFWDHRVHFKNELQKAGFGDLFANTLWDENWKKLGVAETAHYPDGSYKRHFFQREDGPVTDDDRRIKAEIEEEFDLLRTYTRAGNKNLIIGGVNPMPVARTVDARVLEELTNHLAAAGGEHQTLSGRTVDGPDPDKPILLHFGLHLPHTPVLPPQSIRERFQQHTYALPAFDQEEFDKLPPQLQKLQQVTGSDTMTDAEKQQAIQDYYAFCALGDVLIGEAVEAFQDYCEQQGRPWLIVYVIGDHSWHLGEQGTMGKFGPWHQSIGNAFIVVCSDKSLVPAGQVYTDLVEFVDIVPTLIQAAGADLTADEFDYLDGVSLFDQLHSHVEPRDYALGEVNVIVGPRAYLVTDRFRFSMRTRSFNGTVPPNMLGEQLDWALHAPVEEVDLALYDLERDPLERNNVANDPEYRELAAFLRDKLGRIVLGDGRIEADWSQENTYHLSNFAQGADDKQLDIPANLIP